MRTTTLSVRELPTRQPTDASPADEPAAGVIPGQGFQEAEARGWISSGDYRILPGSVQPASLDLRLGDRALPLRCSFLPDSRSTVEDKIRDLAFPGGGIDLTNGAILEPNRPYLIPLLEELDLPPQVRGKANPKSSTGRLDVFTRVITDWSNRFDEIAPGYEGKLYLEVVPRSFAVRVQARASLNQLRLFVGRQRISDGRLSQIHEECPLLYTGATAVPQRDLTISDGLFLGVDLSGGSDEIVGYRAKGNSHPLDLARVEGHDWRDYWEPVHPDPGSRIILQPEVFYLLLSAEGVCVPPDYAAEMMAYDPTAGELRTHYAGFFDPGFGYDAAGRNSGTRAALEVRARDVPFMVEHQQPICKLAFEDMLERPAWLYGAEAGAHYQGQTTMLSKHFARQTRESIARRASEVRAEDKAEPPSLFDDAAAARP